MAGLYESGMTSNDVLLDSLEKSLPLPVQDGLCWLPKKGGTLHEIPGIADTVEAFRMWIAVCSRPKRVTEPLNSAVRT